MNFGKIINYEYKSGTLTLQYQHGNCYVQQMADGILRFTTKLNKESFAVVLDTVDTCDWNISKKNDEVIVQILGNKDNHTKNITLRIGENFLMDIYEDDELICSDYRGKHKEAQGLTEEQKNLASLEGHATNDNGDSSEAIKLVKALNKDDAIYGLGDKPGCLNRRGYTFENWNTDDPAPHVDCFRSLYKSIPFFIVLGNKNCYGIFADNTYRTTFDFGKESDDYYYIRHEKGDLDYYYIAGKDMAQVVSRYTDLTGHTAIPQKWIFGYHQSRWSYNSEAEIRELVDNFKAKDIPCDCVHLDIDYMDGFRVFTFNKDNFPNPKKLTEDLEAQGIKLIAIIDPGVKKDEEYQIYKDGIEMDAFAHAADGTVYENAVWPGTSVFPDFTREDVRLWWGDNLKKLVDVGIRGIWNDMNEPASFNGPLPDDVLFAIGTHDKVHNIYGHLMAEATYDSLRKYDNERRPFVLTRACYAGSQRFCSGWTGDNHSIWAHIQLALLQMCSLGLSGMIMCGSDIGGFSSDPTPELMARFFEAAIFSPFFRSHSSIVSRRQEPWTFNYETTDIIRKVIKLRYRFLPYIYDVAYESMKTGAPILRPLVYQYPYDKNVRNLFDEYMLGSQVLVAPVVEPGKTARAVYLPEGQWYDYTSGKCYEGGQHILAEVPIDHVPIYIKAGSILPLVDKDIMNVDELRPEDVVLHVYKGVGSHVHYSDDGETFAYENGAYKAVLYEQTEDGTVNKTVLHNGYNEVESKIIHVR